MSHRERIYDVLLHDFCFQWTKCIDSPLVWTCLPQSVPLRLPKEADPLDRADVDCCVQTHSGSHPKQSQIDWQHYDPTVVQTALENDNPVLIKFTADWCTNCKIVDKNVYKNQEIAAFLTQKGFVAIKADTTQQAYQATIDYNSVFNGRGVVPNTVLLNPDKKTIANLRGIFTPEELRQIITDQF